MVHELGPRAEAGADGTADVVTYPIDAGHFKRCDWLGAAIANGVECDHRGSVRAGEGVEVLLRGCDAGVTHSFLYDLKIGPAG